MSAPLPPPLSALEGALLDNLELRGVTRRLRAAVLAVVLDVIREDGVGAPPVPDPDVPLFTAGYERRVLDRVGHFLPHEAPEAVVRAVRDLAGQGSLTET